MRESIPRREAMSLRGDADPASNARDGIFADGLSAELATVSGDPASGLTANFQVAL